MGCDQSKTLDQSKPGKSGKYSQFQLEALQRHNELRAKHGAPPLVLDDKLNAIALKYAKHLLKTDKFEHSDKKSRIYNQDDTGENLYTFWSTAKLTPTGAEPTDSWYNEIKDYDFKKPGLEQRGVVGHFTQMIWKETDRMGIAFADREAYRDNKIVVVANYYPAGNVFDNVGDGRDRFRKNVLRAH